MLCGLPQATFTLAGILPVLLLALTAYSQTLSTRSEPWTVTERGPHHAVHERIETVDLGGGRVERIPHRYVELASGLHYWEDKQWKASKAEFTLLPNGYAVAAQGQHKTVISPILNDSQGAVDLETPEGRRMRSTILGLALRDRVTGQQMLIAEIKPATGRQVAPNQILFEDCFDDVRADVRLTYERGGFHQDVILRQKLDPGWLEKNGFSADTTRLEIWTEFFEAPEPKVRRQVLERVEDPSLRKLMAEPDVVEEDLDFGSIKIPVGRAYARGSERETDFTVSVPKRWYRIEGRTFLVESLSLAELQPLLADLQPREDYPVAQRSRELQAGLHPPAPRLQEPGTNTILTASVSRLADAPGVVLDYQTVIGTLTDFTFQGDTTYYVSGTIACYGTSTIEGGAVIKFAPASYELRFFGPVRCLTAPYRPAVFTARDDNSVGEVISGSTGVPQAGLDYGYAGLVYFYSGASADFHDLRLLYQTYGIAIVMAGTHTVRDCQLLNQRYGLYAAGSTVSAQNLLFARIRTGTFYCNSPINAEHITVHNASQLRVGSHPLNVTNSLFINVTNWGGTFTSAFNATNSGADIFQAAGGGAHYLAPNSPYRNAGTANISPVLLATLRTKTTHPPIAYTNHTFTNDLVLAPQAQRDTDAPDLGYHYDPLDHVFGGSHAYANITVQPGTAVGWFRTSQGWYHAGHGIHLGDGKTISFEGMATEPVYWVRCNAVQEGGNSLWYGPGGITGWAATYAQAPLVRARFLRCSMLGSEWANHFRDDWGYLNVEATHSEFWGGGLGAYVGRHCLTNCLLDRAGYSLQAGGADTNAYRIFRNCTMRGGTLYINRWTEGDDGYVWLSVRDCAFDNTRLDSSSDFLRTNAVWNDFNFNAYLSTNYHTNHTGANDVWVTNFNWQAGPSGDFYLPSDSSVIDAGSVTASAAGLYHYTTQTDQTKEAGSQVDIGYHYVAVASDCDDQTQVWVEDALPAGAVPYSDSDSWTWVSANPFPYSGTTHHQSSVYAAMHQHYFLNATDRLPVAWGASLFAYVYLDPANPPAEVMLQWNNGSWEHRAYWGANSIGWGTDGTASRRYMGGLPAVGQWVRLEVPASQVGLEGSTLSGMAFTLYGGRASWDHAGCAWTSCTHRPLDTDLDGVADYFEDSNGNGTYSVPADVANWQDADSDDDGLEDGLEVALGTSPTTSNPTQGQGGSAALQVFTPLH